MTCVLCRETVIEDAAVYGRNPQTNRLAIVHFDCLRDAYDNLSDDEKDDYNDYQEEPSQ